MYKLWHPLTGCNVDAFSGATKLPQNMEDIKKPGTSLRSQALAILAICKSIYDPCQPVSQHAWNNLFAIKDAWKTGLSIQYNKINGKPPVGSLTFSLKRLDRKHKNQRSTLPSKESKEPHIQQQRHRHRTDHLVSHQMAYVLGCRDVFLQWVRACDGGLWRCQKSPRACSNLHEFNSSHPWTSASSQKSKSFWDLLVIRSNWFEGGPAGCQRTRPQTPHPPYYQLSISMSMLNLVDVDDMIMYITLGMPRDRTTALQSSMIAIGHIQVADTQATMFIWASS